MNFLEKELKKYGKFKTKDNEIIFNEIIESKTLFKIMDKLHFQFSFLINYSNNTTIINPNKFI